MLGAACRLCPPGTAALSAVSAPDLNAETSQHPQCECALRAALGLTTGSQGWCVRAEQVHFMMHHSEGAWSKVEQARLQWLQIFVDSSWFGKGRHYIPEHVVAGDKAVLTSHWSWAKSLSCGLLGTSDASGRSALSSAAPALQPCKLQC